MARGRTVKGLLVKGMLGMSKGVAHDPGPGGLGGGSGGLGGGGGAGGVGEGGKGGLGGGLHGSG